MKKLSGLFLLVVFCGVWCVPSAFSADTKDAKSPPPPPAKPNAPAPKSGQVTQCELARLLVNVLGLARFLPANPSCQQCFAILMDNGIAPADGWVTDKVVNKADLARVIVLAMKKQNEVANPNDPRSWIEYLRSIGVPIDTIGESMEFVEPLPEPVAPNVVASSTDPLVRRRTFDPLDETQYGTDMAAIARLLSTIEFTPSPTPTPPTPTPKPKPVTED